MPNFAQGASAMNKKLWKSELDTFDGLASRLENRLEMLIE